MITLSITSSESTMLDLIQLIKQYFNNFNHKVEVNKLKNDKKCQSHGCMSCATIDHTLMCIMILVWMIYVFYPVINHLEFQEMISLYVSCILSNVSLLSF